MTQVPMLSDAGTVASSFGSHQASVGSVVRGGALWIRYPTGTLKNLTAAAGCGMVGFQGADSIAVRDPDVHWSGTKALFSMVVGAPSSAGDVRPYRWQIFKISGLAQGQTPQIVKLANQPIEFNNVSLVYGSDDRALFTSDRPRMGQAQLYPQLEEYDMGPTVTGVWSLNPVLGDLFALTASPSGDFTSIVDSFGRVLFTRRDHMQRDHLADIDNAAAQPVYGIFTCSDEVELLLVP